ncbi:MAG: hypothetical protein P8L31_06840 [Pseudomonadales bacterium]|nr:hypothetical protein [Pseudomonadales bacterium]
MAQVMAQVMAMISTWWYALVFICALPLSVWLLASILGVLDRRPLITPLIQTLSSGVFITLFLLLTHRSFLSPLAAAFAVVTLLHLISGAALRRSLGISTYSSEPKLENDPQEEDSEHYPAANLLAARHAADPTQSAIRLKQEAPEKKS